MRCSGLRFCAAPHTHCSPRPHPLRKALSATCHRSFPSISVKEGRPFEAKFAPLSSVRAHQDCPARLATLHFRRRTLRKAWNHERCQLFICPLSHPCVFLYGFSIRESRQCSRKVSVHVLESRPCICSILTRDGTTGLSQGRASTTSPCCDPVGLENDRSHSVQSIFYPRIPPTLLRISECACLHQLPASRYRPTCGFPSDTGDTMPSLRIRATPTGLFFPPRFVDQEFWRDTKAMPSSRSLTSQPSQPR